SLFLERLAAVKICVPGENMTPAQANGRPGAILPETRSACLLLPAPPATGFISAVDLPPRIESVEMFQPAPNFAVGWPSSKSLIGRFSPGFIAAAAWARWAS